MKYSYVVNLLWIPGLSTVTCSELYDLPVRPLVVRSNALSSQRVVSRAARSPTDKSATPNAKGSPSPSTTPPKIGNKSVKKENAPSDLKNPQNNNGKGNQPTDSRADFQDAKFDPLGTQSAGNHAATSSNNANGKSERNFSEKISKQSSGSTMGSSQKGKKNSAKSNAELSAMSKRMPASRGIPSQPQNGSWLRSRAKDKNGKLSTAASTTNIKGKVLRSTNTRIKPSTRSTRIDKTPMDEPDNQLCKRAGSGRGCWNKKKFTQRLPRVKSLSRVVSETVKSSGSMELGKMRSFWQSRPGVFPPACLTTTGTIIVACVNVANAIHDPHVNGITLAAGSSLTASALVYGLVAGYHGHAKKESLSKEHLKNLGDGLTGKAIQMPVDIYNKSKNCLGASCLATGLEKAATCIGTTCKYIGLNKAASCIGQACTFTSKSSTSETNPIETTQSAPQALPNTIPNPRVPEKIVVAGSRDLRLVPAKSTTPPDTSVASSSRHPQQVSEIQPDDDVLERMEAGTLASTGSSGLSDRVGTDSWYQAPMYKPSKS